MTLIFDLVSTLILLCVISKTMRDSVQLNATTVPSSKTERADYSTVVITCSAIQVKDQESGARLRAFTACFTAVTPHTTN